MVIFCHDLVIDQARAFFSARAFFRRLFHNRSIKKMIGKKVLIRSYGSGVHFGTLVSEQFTQAGKVVVLENSRRIHRWEGACSCSQIATDGISGDRVSVVVPLIEVVNVIETIPLSEKAIINLENQPVWKS